MTNPRQRRRFVGRTYFELNLCINAERAERINEMLDSGKRLFGDTSVEESPKDQWKEIDEAIHPYSHGIACRFKDESHAKIYAYEVRE